MSSSNSCGRRRQQQRSRPRHTPLSPPPLPSSPLHQQPRQPFPAWTTFVSVLDRRRRASAAELFTSCLFLLSHTLGPYALSVGAAARCVSRDGRRSALSLQHTYTHKHTHPFFQTSATSSAKQLVWPTSAAISSGASPETSKDARLPAGGSSECFSCHAAEVRRSLTSSSIFGALHFLSPSR